MTDDLARYLAPPPDPDQPVRAERLRELGIGDIPDVEFDAFASKVAERTGAPFAFVNFIDDKRQYFAGLHVPGEDGPGDEDSVRTMANDHGYCVYVVGRRRALALENMRDYARYHGNPVVEELGFKAYLGAPLLDTDGTILGTVAVTDTEPRRWGMAGIELMKSLAAELMEQIHQRRRSLAQQTG